MLVEFVLMMLIQFYKQQINLISEEFYDNTQTTNNGWSVTTSDNSSTNFTDCAGTLIFGGTNKFTDYTQIQKIFSLPDHDYIKISFTLWNIDINEAYSQNYNFRAYVDSTKLLQHNYSTTGYSEKCEVYQSSRQEYMKDFVVESIHYSNSAIIIFNSTDNYHFGISNFKLLVKQSCLLDMSYSQIIRSDPCWANRKQITSFLNIFFNDQDGWQNGEIQTCYMVQFNYIRGQNLIKQIKLPPHNQIRLFVKLLLDPAEPITTTTILIDQIIIFESLPIGGKIICSNLEFRLATIDSQIIQSDQVNSPFIVNRVKSQ